MHQSLLVLISLCSFTMCHQHEYHFIKEMKTWEDARKFCRAHYSDLVTVNDMTHMKQIREEENCCKGAWIGLYNKNNPNYNPENRQWHWSLPGKNYSESEAKWNQNEPNDVGGNENCVIIHKNATDNNLYWSDLSCCEKRPFICYDDNPVSKYTLRGDKTWLEAVDHCRRHHTDLLSGLDQFNDPALIRNIPHNDPTQRWMGLFRDTWGWSDGSSSSFRNWDEDYKALCESPGTHNNCTKLGGDDKWKSVSCTENNPFICFDDKMILIKEKKTWEEALYYCRENYGDLAWITDDHQQRTFQKRAKMADTEFVWVGVFYSCFMESWIWVHGEWLDFHNWKKEGLNDCNVSGAVEKRGQNKWVKRPPLEKNNFVCNFDGQSRFNGLSQSHD